MTTIILAAGTSIPFKGELKQLLDVGGETLLDRQVRQFGPHSETIYVMTHHGEALHHSETITVIPRSRRWKCDTLLSSGPLWATDDDTIIIHGDVYFPASAVDIILKTSGDPPAFFWNDGIEGTEAYGLRFSEDRRAVILQVVLDTVRHAVDTDAPPHDCGLMHLMATCESAGVSINRVALVDGTRDFDNPEKYAEWRKAMGLK